MWVGVWCVGGGGEEVSEGGGVVCRGRWGGSE